MGTLTVNTKVVLGAYRKASKESRKLLEGLFENVNFCSNTNVTDRIETFEDACEELEYSNITPMCGQLPDKYHSPVKSFYMMQVISEALNEGWVADWNNSDQAKYFPYFKLVNGKLVYAGVAARYSSSVLGFADSDFVSRLCFNSEALAEYAGKQFIDLYSDYILTTF